MRLSGFNLNQLVCLEALLHERSVTKASERVNLSQPAMSAVLAQLRQHFGDELLVKSGRSLVLTPFANSLIAPISELLMQAHEFAARRPNLDFGRIDRELKLVASDYLLKTCLAEAVSDAADEMPGLRFDLLPLTENSARLLHDGEIDMMIAGQSLDVGMPPKATIFEDEFVCIACSDQGPASGELTQENFGDFERVVIRYFEHQMSFEDEEALRHAGVPSRHQMAVWSYSLVPHLICGSRRVATIPSRLAIELAKRWPVAIHPFPFELAPVRAFAFWHSSRDSDQVLQRFMGLLKT